MERLGTTYGGWIVPNNMSLSDDSICYLGGVGEDASFDILLQHKYGSHVYMIDPTKRALHHYNELITDTHFSGNIQNDYYKTISGVKYDKSKLVFVPIGLWNEDNTLKFYKQTNPNYVSQSLLPGMFGQTYDIIKVNTIKSIMKKFNHTHIDLLKLDIEGAECNVLNQMLDDNIYPKYVLVEFDILLKNKDTNNETIKVIQRMKKLGYQIICNDKLNITFVFNNPNKT